MTSGPWRETPAIAHGIADTRRSPLLGRIALAMALTGPGLMVIGFLWSMAMGVLYPLFLFGAAVIAIPLAVAGLTAGAVAAITARGRWTGLAGAAVSLPAGALAVLFTTPLIEYLSRL